jgi:hypothetical protein
MTWRLLPCLLLLAACEMPEFGGSAAPATGSAATAETVAPIAGGVADEPMRVLRSYYAASGRECREVVLGAGMGERASLVCQDGAGGWIPSRPLLGGGSGRGMLASGSARP